MSHINNLLFYNLANDILHTISYFVHFVLDIFICFFLVSSILYVYIFTSYIIYITRHVFYVLHPVAISHPVPLIMSVSIGLFDDQIVLLHYPNLVKSDLHSSLPNPTRLNVSAADDSSAIRMACPIKGVNTSLPRSFTQISFEIGLLFVWLWVAGAPCPQIPF